MVNISTKGRRFVFMKLDTVRAARLSPARVRWYVVLVVVGLIVLCCDLSAGWWLKEIFQEWRTGGGGLTGEARKVFFCLLFCTIRGLFCLVPVDQCVACVCANRCLSWLCGVCGRVKIFLWYLCSLSSIRPWWPFYSCDRHGMTLVFLFAVGFGCGRASRELR